MRCETTVGARGNNQVEDEAMTSTDPRTPAELAALYAARDAHNKKLTEKRRIDAERWMAEVKKRKEKRK